MARPISCGVRDDGKKGFIVYDIPKALDGAKCTFSETGDQGQYTFQATKGDAKGEHVSEPGLAAVISKVVSQKFADKEHFRVEVVKDPAAKLSLFFK